MEVWVLGGDARNYWAAQQLRAAGHTVHTCGVPGLADEALPERFGALLLPFPAFAGDCLRGEKQVAVLPLLEHMDAGTRICGGLLSAWAGAFRTRGASVTDLYDTEPLTTENAAATAEGAVALALTRSAIALQGARCLVIGFGRIGKLLALRLHALGATVTAAARRPGDRAMAEAMGLESDVTGLYHHGLYAYDFIFNTVPAPVLSRLQLSRLKKDCLLLELASAPGGVDPACCGELGLTVIAAPGLPGTYAPKTAGLRYAEAALRHLEMEEIS